VIYYNFYPGDYLRDTGHLSVAEHGIYSLLMANYYATEKPPVADPNAVYRLCRCITDEEKLAADSVVKQFFSVKDGNLHHERIDSEIAKMTERVKANREKGSRGGKAAVVARAIAAATPPAIAGAQPQGVAKVQPQGVASQSHIHKEQVQELGTPDGAPAGPAVAEADSQGLPDCPHEKILALYHQLLPTCPEVQSWGDARQGYLRARWREKAEPFQKHRGYKTLEEGLAYWERFFVYCSTSKFLTGKTEGSKDRPPFVADLEWLVRPTNFAKVIEGKYHAEA
jgi:uncharacterized protein YdaU (DUF1376 family)